jgi:hypothetical protein
MALALRLILDRICEPNGVVQSPVNGPSLIPDPGSLGSPQVPAPNCLSSPASFLSDNEGAKTDISNH